MKRLACSALLCCFALALPPAWAEIVSLKIGKQTVRAEIAHTPQSRERGLMGRDRLCADCGMLFVFDRAGRYAFWMKNTPLPLSIAFIASDGRILNTAEMQPNTTDPHPAQGDALYALEMNREWFARHGVKPGDKVLGLERAPRARQK
ncbi:MAG: hypothetical protein FD134_1854 [Gallionellaceae bacterium]|nr:MAG: hypothetical protein FD134_1854 [Gallionellaceae bacterium]